MEWENAELGRLFTPLILTPEQYYDERRDDSALRPIKRLMLAILEDALICLRNYANTKNRKHQLMYREAERWLCRDGGNAPFSFVTVCETLGIEPNYLRSGLRQWGETQSRGEGEQRVGRRSPVMRNGSISAGRAGHARWIRDRPIPVVGKEIATLAAP
jgi:hypothetical protein